MDMWINRFIAYLCTPYIHVSAYLLTSILCPFRKESKTSSPTRASRSTKFSKKMEKVPLVYFSSYSLSPLHSPSLHLGIRLLLGSYLLSSACKYLSTKKHPGYQKSFVQKASLFPERRSLPSIFRRGHTVSKNTSTLEWTGYIDESATEHKACLL